MKPAGRLILIEPDEPGRAALASRLEMQGFSVQVASDAGEGAFLALASPPSAVIADLWMPSISGVQLCRLLRAEPATENVPVLLRGPDDRRNRFLAEHAGASAYVVKGRMGDLVRALSRAIAAGAGDDDGFFLGLTGHGNEIRDRIAAHLDQALLASVIAAEVRALSVCGELTRLFDLFTQFLSQVMSYRWMAMTTDAPPRFALHAHPARRAAAEAEARAELHVEPDRPVTLVEDEDAHDLERGPPPVVYDLSFVDLPLGRLALAPRADFERQDTAIMSVVARELGAPVRMAFLVEEAQRLATVDPLTRLLNRRAFLAAGEGELERARRLGYSVGALLLDVDHFKQVNDRHGHASGDVVLLAVSELLGRELRQVDLIARWGGEEFVALLPGTDACGAALVAERVRASLESMVVRAADGERIPVTASFGVASWEHAEAAAAVLDRADRAMYAAKHAGRNRVCVARADERSRAVAAE